MTSPSATLGGTRRSSIMGLARRAWAGLRFRDAFLLSLLPLTLVVLLFGGAVFDYARARQFDDWWSNAQSVASLFRARVRALTHAPATLAARHRFDPDSREAAILRLTVEGRDWDRMQGDPLGMWGEWVDARLDDGGTVIPVRVRKRGDNSVHWLTDKRTITVRTPRDEFYKRFRSFGLSAKDVIPSYLANRLAAEFGVLAPSTDVIPVYLNNRFYGVYRFVELPDESFLRPFDRMPGNIFRADRAERGEYFKGVQRNVFENPSLWDRTAVNDRWTSAGPGQLRLLLDDLQGATFEDHQRLMSRLDRADLARLFAYLLVVGDPYHMDGVHNQLLYEDPSTQRLHPIPWDIRLLDLSARGNPLNALFQAVLKDPFLVDATVRELSRRLSGDRLETVADSLLGAVERRYGPYLEYDRGRAGLVPDIGSSEAALGVIRRNLALLRRRLADDTVAIHASRSGDVVVMDLETRGWSGANLVALSFAARARGPVEVRLDRNRNGVLDPQDPVAPLGPGGPDADGRVAFTRPVELLSSWSTGAGGIAPGHVAYRLFLTGVDAGTAAPVLLNRATGGPTATIPWEAGAVVRPATGWHPWEFRRTVGSTVRLAGTVRLDQTVEIAETDTLVLEAGTTLRLAPDVSIISRGPVLALGTRDRPVRVLPDQPGRPWGTFSLQDHGADGSAIRWTEFIEGGGGLVRRIEYIGMVNVHLARNVEFDHVTFEKNLRSDDTFHALHAEVRLTNSRFIQANSDAVDFDVSTGEITGNTFESTGGDAIDLMASAPRIVGNVIRRSGDKGISVGEASRPFIFDNLIENCTIGIEVKDRSEPVILNNEIVGSGRGLRERRKNWRYGGGGWATIVNTAFRESKVTRQRDTLSRITRAGLLELGEDGLADSTTPLGWLYRQYGLAPMPAVAGRPASWRAIPAVPPLIDLTFVDDFAPLTDGWDPAAGVTRIEKRRDALRLYVERREGSAVRKLSWSLDGPGTAVLEVAGRDLAGARAVFYAGRDSVSHEFLTGDDPSSFRFVVIPLPPGQYEGVRIDLTPKPGLSHSVSREGLFVVRSGRLELRRFSVYSGAP